MGKFSRDKGARIERKIRDLHEEMGVACERVPLSGAAGGSFGGDLIVDGEFRCEVKGRANGDGFKTLERWLGENSILFLNRDRAEPLVVLPWSTYRRVMSPEVNQ